MKTFIIAELSANHGGSLETAIETIKAAKRTGADAIKLQTQTPDTMTLNAKTEDFLVKGNTLWDGQYLHDLYQAAYTPWEWHETLFRVAKAEGLVCFSSPFSIPAVDFLEKLDNPIYKIASFEIVDIPLIKRVAQTGKPMIMSTGIATLEDITLALETAKANGCTDMTLLKCTSSYPAPIEAANLSMIPDMASRFGVKVGLSDHSLGALLPTLAVGLGACIIEKHFILNKQVNSVDMAFSMDESEFKAMVTQVRLAEQAMGKVDYTLSDSTQASKVFARSLYIAEDMPVGAVLTPENLVVVRPGYGAHPKYYEALLGKKVKKPLTKGTRVNLSDIEGCENL